MLTKKTFNNEVLKGYAPSSKDSIKLRTLSKGFVKGYGSTIVLSPRTKIRMKVHIIEGQGQTFAEAADSLRESWNTVESALRTAITGLDRTRNKNVE